MVLLSESAESEETRDGYRCKKLRTLHKLSTDLCKSCNGMDR